MQVGLLVAASALMLLRPRRTPVWAGPVLCATFGLATTAIPAGAAWTYLGTLRNPLLFFGLAVPLAVTLDDVGVSAAIAGELDGGAHLVAKL
ncbi:MAG: hypothetical protein ACR2MB_08550 [Acidimicrobiales bacterium]